MLHEIIIFLSTYFYELFYVTSSVIYQRNDNHLEFLEKQNLTQVCSVMKTCAGNDLSRRRTKSVRSVMMTWGSQGETRLCSSMNSSRSANIIVFSSEYAYTMRICVSVSCTHLELKHWNFSVASPKCMNN